MEKTQHEFLSKRIDEVPAPGRRHKTEQRKTEPERIKRAREVIDTYETQMEKRERQNHQAFVVSRNKAREALHSGDYDKALSAVHSFEAQYGSDD